MTDQSALSDCGPMRMSDASVAVARGAFPLNKIFKCRQIRPNIIDWLLVYYVDLFLYTVHFCLYVCIVYAFDCAHRWSKSANE